ncbi:MAG: Uma2 family endonuclease [Actinobacteria bacterium]|nr:Uma2 family endonuclease [Actinomycetota bacterium]
MVKGPTEQRVLLRNVSWETYERLISEREERPVPRFFYDRGVLEIVSPSKGHESISCVVALLVEELAVELDVDVEGAGSTTFKREDLARGFEPDECFYFQDIEHVRGKKDIDLDAGDPPPDLVFEVDVTNPSLDKLPIFAQVGVAEIWRYSGGRMEMFGLRGEELRYEEIAESIRPASPDERRTRALRQGGPEDEAPGLGTQGTRMGAEPGDSASARRRLAHPEDLPVSAMVSCTPPQPSLVARLSWG